MTEAPADTDRVEKTDAEWRAQLSDLAYKVTRKHGTERAFSHDAYPAGAGRFHCICCDAVLFDKDQKFDSGTGWPSFWAPLAIRARRPPRCMLSIRTLRPAPTWRLPPGA